MIERHGILGKIPESPEVRRHTRKQAPEFDAIRTPLLAVILAGWGAPRHR